MVFGYDQPRPTADTYCRFMEHFLKGLEGLRIDGLSLLVYGSFLRPDFSAGRSDIDGVLVFPDRGVIDKHNLRAAGHCLKEALHPNPLPLQVTVTDLATM